MCRSSNLIKYLFCKQSPEKRKADIARNALTLVKKIFDTNKIKFGEISEIFTITGGDYTGLFFDKVRASIENRQPANFDSETFTWYKPHLHFEMVILDDNHTYVIAIVYPYEISEHESVLWFYSFDRDRDQGYINSLKRFKIY